MFCLYSSEVISICDNVYGDDGLLEEFYDWLDAWDKHLFTRANLIVIDRKKKKNYHFRYVIKNRSVAITQYDDKDEKIICFTDSLDIEKDQYDIRVKQVGDVHYCMPVFEPGEKAALDMLHEPIVSAQSQIGGGWGVSQQEFESLESLLQTIPEDDPRRPIFLKRLSDMLQIQNNSIAAIEKRIRKNHIKIQKIRRKGTFRAVLAILFYFHLREPRQFEATNERWGTSYKKHNDLYNPFKRLHPERIVRCKTGTSQWFNRTYTRKTESWWVKGHKRRYKSGKVVWIEPYIKGDGEVTQLSIYGQEVGGAKALLAAKDLE